jgi:predicted phosphate transport protein (TIGR00153 family)
MQFNLLPKEKIFYDLLEKLAKLASESATLFRSLTESWQLDDVETKKGCKRIKDLEHEGDAIVEAIMFKLNKSFITPIDREDIHRLATETDDLIDIIHALSERLVLFRIKEASMDLKQMAMIFEKSVELVCQAIHKIRDLRLPEGILQLCDQINELENRGDRAFESALSTLFNDARNPIDVIKWKEIYDFLEMGIDKSEDIADILGGICVKYG